VPQIWWIIGACWACSGLLELWAQGYWQHHCNMSMPPKRLPILEPCSSAGPESPWSSSASQETESAIPLRYVLPSNLEEAIRRLDDQQLDRLVSVALEERARRKQPPVPEKSQRKRNAEAVSSPLPQGKLNAVRAAFKAGVTPARIAREFGISRSDVQRALCSDATK
jgi:hypothetical protein